MCGLRETEQKTRKVRHIVNYQDVSKLTLKFQYLEVYQRSFAIRLFFLILMGEISVP